MSKTSKKKNRKKRLSANALWSRYILERIKKNKSLENRIKNYNFYTNNLAFFSRRDNISIVYAIDGLPNILPMSFKDNIRKLANIKTIGQTVIDSTKVSFIEMLEPTEIDWSSPRIKSRIRTWQKISKETQDEGVDEFSYHDKSDTLSNMDWRKESLVYLSDADTGQDNRSLLVYRSIIIVSGVRGDSFDKANEQIVKYCKNIGVKIKRVERNLFGYLKTFSPFTTEKDNKVLKMIGNITMTDEIIARISGYDQGKIGKEGTIFGSDIYSGLPVYKVIKKNEVAAENIMITAETGGGKSFLTKFILLQLLAQDDFVGTINDIEGFEYIPFAYFIANHDKVVILNMAEGQGNYYDPVEIILSGNKDMDKEMFSVSESYIGAIFRVILGDELSNSVWGRNIINTSISRFYTKIGVNPDDMNTWERSKGYTLFDVYQEIKAMYSELINNKHTSDLILDEVKKNKKYRESLEESISVLSSYFEDFSNGGVKRNVFKKRVSLSEVINAKLLICSFGMQARDWTKIDPVQMALSQLSAANISYLRSVFSKERGKYNFKVWEEFQRWGNFPDSDKTISTALTGGRKLGDVNFIITNNVKDILDNDRFAMLDNITTFAIGAIKTEETRKRVCERLSVPLLQDDLDTISERRGSKEELESTSMVSGMYDKAFLTCLDGVVSTVLKVELPSSIASSTLFKTGIDLGKDN